MSKKDKEFYVWTMAECIKSAYEWWGIDMMSMYGNIKEDFPNAIVAIHKMYDNLKEPDFYESKFLVFEKAEYCRPQCRNQANVYKSRAKNK